MSTATQVLANRQNAQSSTGPSTPEGKATSSHNATTHGLSCASFALLPHEDREAFDRHIESYRRRFAPTDDHEAFLVERMVESRWKLARANRLEAAVLNQMLSEDHTGASPDSVIAAAMLKGNANAYLALQRHAAAAERSYYKAKRELEKGRVPMRGMETEIPLSAVISPRAPFQNKPNPEPAKPVSAPLTGPQDTFNDKVEAANPALPL